MLHTWKCTQCPNSWQAYCFEDVNYTKRGWQQRKKQIDLGLCDECFKKKFGKLPEQRKRRTAVPILVLG